jgi:ribosomal protein S3
VAHSELVRKLLVALSESLPEGADVSSIGVDSNDAVNVTLHTHSAGLLIGRQGATADAIRSSLQGVVGERVVKLNIHELGRDDPPPPPVVDDELRSTL